MPFTVILICIGLRSSLYNTQSFTRLLVSCCHHYSGGVMWERCVGGVLYEAEARLGTAAQRRSFVKISSAS